MNSAIPELVNLANGLAVVGDKLAVRICRDTIAEIERLQAIIDKLQQVADTGILPDGDHVNLPTKMWLEELDTEAGRKQ